MISDLLLVVLGVWLAAAAPELLLLVVVSLAAGELLDRWQR